jgi:hypothetical protein
VVKRKMSNFGVKRPEHRRWPPPPDIITVIDPEVASA